MGMGKVLFLVIIGIIGEAMTSFGAALFVSIAHEHITGFILILIGNSILAYIPRSIAIYKGYSGNKWWLYGFLIFPIALIHSLYKGKSEARMILDGTHKKCPYCAEIIKKEAKVCHYCGRDVGENLRPSLPDAHFTDKIKELSNENKERWRDGETRSCPVCGGVFSADRMQCPFCHALMPKK